MNEAENLQEVESAEDAALWNEVINTMEGREPDDEDHDDEPQETEDETATEEPEAEIEEPEQEEGPTLDQLRAERDALQRERDDWRHRYQSDQGRFLAAQRKLADLHNNRNSEDQREQAAAGIEAIKAGKFGEFANEFPEMADAITELLNSQKAELLNTFNRELEPVREMRQREIQQQEYNAFQQAVTELSTRHPDWEQYSKETNPDFAQWLSAKSAEVQSLYGRPDPTAAALLIDSYKFDKGLAQQQAPRTNERAEKIQQQRQQKLERSTLPTTRGGSVQSTDTEDALWDSVVRQLESKR